MLEAPKAAPGSNAKRCSIGCSGAELRSKPPSEPTPEPRPISSIAGMMARGTMEGAVGSIDGALERTAEETFGFCDVPDAAAAKLAMGRALIRAWRMEARGEACTNCQPREEPSVFAAFTLTLESYGG